MAPIEQLQDAVGHFVAGRPSVNGNNIRITIWLLLTFIFSIWGEYCNCFSVKPFAVQAST
jgi:hypothetical protein